MTASTGWRSPAVGWSVCAAVAMAAAVVLWLRLDLSSTPEVTRFRDDAYYYFCWARSLAAGDGPCVSPGIRTSGVHPLWALLLALVASVGGAGVLPVAAHALGLALHAVTAVVVGATVRAAGMALAWSTGLLYAGTAYVVTEAQNGQETALACLLAAVLLALRDAPERRFVIASVAATLARSDLLALVAVLAVRRHGASLRVLQAPAFALVSYAVLNAALTGAWLQDSAAPIPWLFDEHHRAQGPGLTDDLRWLWWWLRPCLLGAPWGQASVAGAAALVVLAAPVLRPAWRALPLAMVAAAWLGGAADLGIPLLAAVLLLALPQEGAPDGRTARWLLLGMFAILLLHHVLRHYPRPYYFAPFGVCAVWAIGMLAARWPRAGAVLIVVAAASEVHRATRLPEQRPWQAESVLAARLVDEVIPAAAPVGMFNAGIVTWLRPGPVLNLDGVVNRSAFAALRSGSLDRYLDAQGVRFVLDVPVQFARGEPGALVSHASGRWFGPDFDPTRDLREIARFDLPGVDGGRAGTDALRLYWRVGRGAEPPVPSVSRDLGPWRGDRRLVLWPAPPGARLRVEGPAGVATVDAGHAAPGVVACFVAVQTGVPGRYILRESTREAPLLEFDVP